MFYQGAKLEQLVTLLTQHSPQEELNPVGSENFATYRVSAPRERTPALDEPAIIIVGQGKKNCYVGDRKYVYDRGRVIIVFYPMPVEAEFVDVGPDRPFLAAGVRIDLGRLADIMLKIERIDGVPARSAASDPSGLFTAPLDDRLLDATIRLVELADKPRDMAVLEEPIIDEIYYRVLTGERGEELRALVQQRGEIQRISRAVEHIHANLDKPVSVEELAQMVHMGRTSFYESFRDVMHMSPLQYAKSVKLDRANTLIRGGKKASETAYLVGYNSPAQFSREYKRYFGYAPSAAH